MQRAVAPFLAFAAAVLAACGGEAGDRTAGSRQAPSSAPRAPTLTCAEGGGAAPNRPGEPTGYVELDPTRDVAAGPLSFVGARDRARSPTSDYEPIGLEQLQRGWPGLRPEEIPPRVRERIRGRSLYSADKMAFVVRGNRAVTLEIPETELAHASLLFDNLTFDWEGADAEFVERFGLAQVSDGRPAVRVEPCASGPTLYGRGFVVAGARCLPLNVWVDGEAEPIRTLISFAAGGCGHAEPVPGWTTYRSAKWGYTVGFPAGWQRATSSLTPSLTDPREILSLGTFPLRYRPTDCEAFAGSAQQDLGDGDAFVTILERGIPTPRQGYPEGKIVGVPPRPERFGADSGRGVEPTDCPGSRALVQWIDFRDAGRYFYALVAFGRSVPGDLRRDAYRILDSLSFDPKVKPDWPGST
jgi:hypothetical protein